MDADKVYDIADIAMRLATQLGQGSGDVWAWQGSGFAVFFDWGLGWGEDPIYYRIEADGREVFAAALSYFCGGWFQVSVTTGDWVERFLAIDAPPIHFGTADFKICTPTIDYSHLADEPEFEPEARIAASPFRPAL